jgi:Transposase IS4
MGEKAEAEHAQYWSSSHRLGRFLGLKRFEQIYRYFTLRDEGSLPKQTNESFTWKLEPVTNLIRQNCRQNWSSSSYLCIDEAMVFYRGRTVHKTKMKNKPIAEGYKIWVLGDNGYVFDWLWHSQREGPEGIPKQDIFIHQLTKTVENGRKMIHLALTFAVIIRLATCLRELHSTRVFRLYLDNLFLNVEVAQALLALDICCMEQLEKTRQGYPHS